MRPGPPRSNRHRPHPPIARQWALPLPALKGGEGFSLPAFVIARRDPDAWLSPGVTKRDRRFSFRPGPQNAKPRQGGQPGFRVPSSRTERVCTAEVGETDGEPLLCIESTLSAMDISRTNYEIEVVTQTAALNRAVEITSELFQQLVR